ncbi:MAG: hypothetical protein ACKVPX_12780 [Myxococcaceae bacterium]
MLKRLLTRWRNGWPVVALLLACGSASAGAPSRHRLELVGNVFRFDGRLLRLMDRSETWTAVLGPASRIREDPSNSFLHWDRLGIVAIGRRTVDGRVYVSNLHVWLKDFKEEASGVHVKGFPGTFFLQGVPLSPGDNRLETVQRALPKSTPLAERGSKVAEDAIMSLDRPDGFKVTVWTLLHCASETTVNRSAEESCLPVFDELTIEANWCCSTE